MKNIVSKIKTFCSDERGGETAEWALVLALVAIAALAGYKLIGTNSSTVTNYLAGQLTTG
jgi:Flp pilus assembly pilin Flp